MRSDVAVVGELNGLRTVVRERGWRLGQWLKKCFRERGGTLINSGRRSVEEELRITYISCGQVERNAQEQIYWKGIDDD